ncbi:MAG: hypothetical protein MJ202_09170, partial [Lentisphaeria bacterium]|nr:hypothetical protein [Lentisphaeria bacterium]
LPCSILNMPVPGGRRFPAGETQPPETTHDTAFCKKRLATRLSKKKMRGIAGVFEMIPEIIRKFI